MKSDEIEALEENFYGALNNKKVEKTDAVKHLIIREENDKLCKVHEKYKIVVE